MADVRHPQAEYEAYLAEGRFMIQRVVGTGEHVFYPRVAQPGTGRTDLEWVTPSGRGTVYSYTVVRNKPPTTSYVIALIDLAEGVRLLSRIVGCQADNVRIGMAVAAHVGEVDGVAAVLFSPVGEDGQ